MYIIVEGWIAFSTFLDGNEFVLERLTRGSIFNNTNFVTEDIMNVNIYCLTPVKLYRISKELFEKFKYNQDENTIEVMDKKVYHLYYMQN